MKSRDLDKLQGTVDSLNEATCTKNPPNHLDFCLGKMQLEKLQPIDELKLVEGKKILSQLELK